MGARRVVLLAVALAALALPGAAEAVVPAGNLVQNPGAEGGEGASDAGTIRPPPGWGPGPSFTAVQYGTNGFPSTALSASIGGGSNFFAGGPDAATSTGEQTVDVSTAATEIDSGRVSVHLRAHLGGFFTDADNAKITAELQDQSADTTFLTLQIGPVTAADRGNQTTLLPRSAIADVPEGTRRIRLTFTATRTHGAYNDGYADNVSLSLDSDPVAVNDSSTVSQFAGVTTPIDVLANDTDPDGGPKQVAVVTQPANGTVTVTGGGSGVSYRPNLGYCNSHAGGAPDTFTYTLNGGSRATVAVTVTCVPPSAFQIFAQPPGCRQRGLLRMGTPGNDTIQGTAASDVILGRSGSDILKGLGGNDCLYGELGNDGIAGGDGSDSIFGSTGSDRLTGGSGSDRVNGNSGTDRISGSTGSDSLTGGSGSDRVNGNSGNDRISGGSGRDTIRGGGGNDRISARDRTRDRVDCGAGRDRVIADRSDVVARSCERVSRR